MNLTSRFARLKSWSKNILILCSATVLAVGAERGSEAEKKVDRGPEAKPGFVVLAPDRGFLGNEETREAFEKFAEKRDAALAIVTDERTRGTLSAALDRVKKKGASEVVVLPLFISAAESRFGIAKKALEEINRLSPCCVTRSKNTGSTEKPQLCPTTGRPVPVEPTMGRTFGESYLAVEVLSDHFRSIHNPKDRRIVVIGSGAKDGESRRRMEADLERIATKAGEGFGFESVRVVVGYDPGLSNYEELQGETREALAEAAKGAERAAFVPFHLGKKLDSMMTLNGNLRRLIPAGTELVNAEITPHPIISMWMEREANRWTPLREEDLGVVFLAHGSDYHWNETMRGAVQEIAERYKLEFAFSMADQPVVERAVRRLEERGASKVVIVRVFGLASSFRSSVEKMIGMDVEHSGRGHATMAAGPVPHGPAAVRAGSESHGGGHGHGHGGGAGGRIRSGTLIVTTGGLEDHAFFAQALLDRARELSVEPGRETVLLAAHGSGDDKVNEHWQRLLNSIAEQMRAAGGTEFHSIETTTWREDWPGKREPEIAAARQVVEEAGKKERRVIVIPARTTSEGFEKKFLAGLEFELGSGFAPHPLFARWVEEQIGTGREALKGSKTTQAEHEQHVSMR